MCFYIVLLHCPFRRAWMGGGAERVRWIPVSCAVVCFFSCFHEPPDIPWLWFLFFGKIWNGLLVCLTVKTTVYDCCVRLLCKYLGISQHHNITTSQYHNITISQHHSITTSHYHNIAISHYHTPVGRFSKVDCSTSKRVPVPIVSHIERHVLRKLSARCFQRRPSRHRHY